MSITLYRLLVDFGLVVLIWIVQLAIYPSFSYFTREGLKQWHKKYTLQITFVVLPLMNVQLVLAIIHLARAQDWFTITSMLIVTGLWLLTFGLFVPMHGKIDREQYSAKTLDQLVQKNWYRTALWSVLVVLDVVYLFLN